MLLDYFNYIQQLSLTPPQHHCFIKYGTHHRRYNKKKDKNIFVEENKLKVRRLRDEGQHWG